MSTRAATTITKRYHGRVCEAGLEFAAWDSILWVPRAKVGVWIRLTLTLTLNLLKPIS